MTTLGEIRIPLAARSAAHGADAPRGRSRIALVSDTHGLLRPETEAFVRGADRIVHGGDIGPQELLVRLQAHAPLTVVRGNNDREPWAAALREREQFEAGGLGILVIHDRAQLRGETLPPNVDVVVSGHSHKPALEQQEGRLYVNPGSAGPRRFKLPVSVAELVIDAHGVTARLLGLDPTGPR